MTIGGPRAPKKTGGGRKDDDFPGLERLDREELDETDRAEREDEGLDWDDESSISHVRRTPSPQAPPRKDAAGG